MQVAQQSLKHTAQLAVMQQAYAAAMAEPSPRQTRRRAKLREIVDSFQGGATGLALIAHTPKSHISAILAGRRGIGDALAAKLERVAEKPPGWMDEMTLTAKELTVLQAMREPDESSTAGDAPSNVVPMGNTARQEPGLRRNKRQKDSRIESTAGTRKKDVKTTPRS